MQDSVTAHMAAVPEVFNGLLFILTLSMYMPNLKSVALPVPEIIAIEVWGEGRNPILGKGRP